MEVLSLTLTIGSVDPKLEDYWPFQIRIINSIRQKAVYAFIVHSRPVNLVLEESRDLQLSCALSNHSLNLSLLVKNDGIVIWDANKGNIKDVSKSR